MKLKLLVTSENTSLSALTSRMIDWVLFSGGNDHGLVLGARLQGRSRAVSNCCIRTEHVVVRRDHINRISITSSCSSCLSVYSNMLPMKSRWLVSRLLLSGLSSTVIAATFPPPFGSFNTTLSTAKLVDHHRNDPYSPTPTPRALMVSIFRPTSPSKCSPIVVDYMDPLTAAFEDEEFWQYGIPAGTFESLRLQVCKPSVWDPRPRSIRFGSCGQYPLLLFSPGLGRTRLLYNAIAQE
jgi:hypothetical protein